jgi:uncharacterized membrane protein
MNTKVLLTSAIGAVISMSGLAGSASAADVRCAEVERCYGVSKAGKNDCATSSSACSGTAKQDSQKDAWVFVPKGTCGRLSGGALAAAKPDVKK